MEILQLAIAMSILLFDAVSPASSSAPLNCSDTARVCTSFLAFKADRSAAALRQIQSMFDVFPQDVTADEDGSPGYVFVRKNCSCLSDNRYLTNTTFTVPEAASSVYPVVVDAYQGLAFLPNMTPRPARARAVVSLRLLCGCSSSLWNYLMSYVMEEGDSVESLSSRFGVSMDSIETVNGMSGPDEVVVGDVYYIPLNSGELPSDLNIFFGLLTVDDQESACLPYAVDTGISPSPTPAPSPTPITFSDAAADLFDMEKPIVFKYEEILSSTDNFSDSNLLGHGKYGSVYYGVLRDQVCRMLAALRSSTNSVIMGSLRDYVDPSLMNLYPHDCVYKVSTFC
ncbi:hypothetical protein GW17_00005718 [Ensete ventricosum]|nr:hypothetical protein GW17_00005718 [Ensete ventricosum]